MHYLDVVRLVTGVLFWSLGAVLVHFLVFAVVGIFKKKTYPRAEEKGNYGLIIPARNEAAVIAGLIGIHADTISIGGIIISVAGACLVVWLVRKFAGKK